MCWRWRKPIGHNITGRKAARTARTWESERWVEKPDESRISRHSQTCVDG